MRNMQIYFDFKSYSTNFLNFWKIKWKMDNSVNESLELDLFPIKPREADTDNQ